MGEIFVILFFGFIAVMGTVFVQTGGWPEEAVLLGAQVGLLSAVLISVNNFRDREERLKESDRLTDAYQEVLEKYMEDPESERKEAFVMG